MQASTRRCVPVWPGVYGPDATRRVVAIATMLAVVVLTAAGVLEHIAPTALAGLVGLGIALSGLALAALGSPSDQRHWVLFKAASVYMLGVSRL